MLRSNRLSVRAMRRYASRLFTGQYTISRRLEPRGWVWECRWDKHTAVSVSHQDELTAKCMLQASLAALSIQPLMMRCEDERC